MVKCLISLGQLCQFTVLKQSGTRLPFNRRQTICMCVYLVRLVWCVCYWPWPWPNDLDTWHFEDVLVYRKWSLYVKAFKRYSPNHTDRHIQTERHAQTDATECITTPHLWVAKIACAVLCFSGAPTIYITRRNNLHLPLFQTCKLSKQK